jgi:hypothetical protein
MCWNMNGNSPLGHGESGRPWEAFVLIPLLSDLLVLTVDSLLFLAHIWSRLYDNVRLLTRAPFEVSIGFEQPAWTKDENAAIRDLESVNFQSCGQVVSSEGLPAMTSNPVSSQERSRLETGSRLLQTCENQLTNSEYSTTENRQVLVQAFGKGQNRGLVNLPSRMHAVGEISFMPGPTNRPGRFCA